jgi:hypothetical protein
VGDDAATSFTANTGTGEVVLRVNVDISAQ